MATHDPATTTGATDEQPPAAAQSKRVLLDQRTAAVLAQSPNLSTLSARILDALKRYRPVTVDGMDPALHWLPPHIAKSEWTALGNLVVAREKAAAFGDEATAAGGCVPGEKWMSLRLDGSNFSKVVKALRRRSVLEAEHRFSERFATCMQHCLRGLMEKVGAQIGYTQSDEMMLLIPPASVVRGEQQGHIRGGRVVKTATLAAAFVTVRVEKRAAGHTHLHTHTHTQTHTHTTHTHAQTKNRDRQTATQTDTGRKRQNREQRERQKQIETETDRERKLLRCLLRVLGAVKRCECVPFFVSPPSALSAYSA
jgi:hypothetical protein